ncbi:MAG: hypothetical protein QOI73_930 [Solirubrobacteraceae bacterium]|nr:hypothetical protein [Solirubrobacteraceae bacterium]
MRVGLVIVVRAAVALVAAAALSGVLSACGSSDSPGGYVALGDSYSSGLGAERYTHESGACLRSSQSYVHQLGRKVTSFRACAGASTDGVLDLQLKHFPANTRLVTITVGGNDAGFLAVFSTCLLRPAATCDRRVAKAERYVRGELAGRLGHVYDAIRRRAPDADVVVAGYPRLVERGPWCGEFGKLDDREQRRLNEAADLLATVMAAEVRRHPGFRFVDARAAFAGHGACADEPWINASRSPGIYSFHPNVRGYVEYARLIKRAL